VPPGRAHRCIHHPQYRRFLSVDRVPLVSGFQPECHSPSIAIRAGTPCPNTIFQQCHPPECR